MCVACVGDLTVSLSDGLTTLEGIHLQLTPANLVCPNVQISGIDPSNINNITLQVIYFIYFFFFNPVSTLNSYFIHFTKVKKVYGT